MNTEYLDVTGVGSTRDLALEHADKQARQYFGLLPPPSNWKPDVSPLTRLIGRAQPMTTTYDGTVQTWSVNVEYRKP